jgi:hypothetical protein
MSIRRAHLKHGLSRFWGGQTKERGVPKKTLRDAVAKVGIMVANVRAHLKKK